jgi:hypothetical protein
LELNKEEKNSQQMPKTYSFDDVQEGFLRLPELIAV